MFKKDDSDEPEGMQLAGDSRRGTSLKPLHTFISEVGGTGKSFLITTGCRNLER